MSIYAFGPFVLDPAERLLTCDGLRVTLPGKAWQILVLLAEAGGRLVSHETFRATLWPNIVVEDRTLTVHVSTLRKGLGSGADVIETVARVGYRLTVPVRVLAASEPQYRGVDGPPMADTRPLAVRAFSTGDLGEADSYLGVGIADAVSTALGAMSGLTVSPVGAVDDLAGARALGLRHMLEGAVQRSDQRLRISARLIDVVSGLTQRSERFEHSRWMAPSCRTRSPHGSRLRFHNCAAAKTRTATGRGRPRPISYSSRRGLISPFTRLPLMKALTLFEQALALDPDYALAMPGSRRPTRLWRRAMLRPLQVDEAMPMARRAALRAIALDEGLAEAWAALGRVKMEYDWDWDGAEATSRMPSPSMAARSKHSAPWASS